MGCRDLEDCALRSRKEALDVVKTGVRGGRLQGEGGKGEVGLEGAEGGQGSKESHGLGPLRRGGHARDQNQNISRLGLNSS